MLKATISTDLEEANFRHLYEGAFAEVEKIPYENLRRTFGNGGVLRIFSDDDEFVGLCYTYEHDNTVFLVYLATRPDLRGHGYGSQILSHMAQENQKKRMFLVLENENEGDSDERALRHRRKEFYRRNGWKDTGVELLSDDYYFDSMYMGLPIPEERMKSTVKYYEDVHNGRLQPDV